MTNEKAIQILDPATSREMLEKMMGGCWDQMVAMALMQEAQQMALDALKEKQDGRLVAHLPGEKVYDRFGTPWIIESAEIHLMSGKMKQLFRCGHPGTDDYYSMYEDEILTKEEAVAALGKREEADDEHLR